MRFSEKKKIISEAKRQEYLKQLPYRNLNENDRTYTMMEDQRREQERKVEIDNLSDLANPLKNELENIAGSIYDLKESLEKSYYTWNHPHDPAKAYPGLFDFYIKNCPDKKEEFELLLRMYNYDYRKAVLAIEVDQLNFKTE